MVFLKAVFGGCILTFILSSVHADDRKEIKRVTLVGMSLKRSLRIGC